MNEEKWIGYRRFIKNYKLRIIAFPYAGGNAMAFKKLFDAFDDIGCDLISIELPGKGKRLNENACTSMSELLDKLYPIMKKLYCDNLVLLGYSMGAIIAYELAVRFQMEGLSLKSLALIARTPPHFNNQEMKRGKMNDEQLKRSMIQLNGTPREIIESQEFLKYYMRIFRNDFILIESYKPDKQIKISSPLLIYGGINDSEAKFLDLYKWRYYAGDQFTYRLYSGDHFFINQNIKRFIALLLNDIKGGN